MNQSIHVETRIDDHRSLIISSEPGDTLASDADAARFPRGGLFYIREHDNRLPVDGATYVLANAASFEAAQRLVKLFCGAAKPESTPALAQEA